jgi:hypothetical protein
LKDVNIRVAAPVSMSPDDLMITLYEASGDSPLARARRSVPTPSRTNKNRMPLELSISPTLTLC